MLDGHLFDTLAEIADRLRKKTDKPFGGVQLVLTGDFFQLPPVSKGDPFFAFESAAWKKCIGHTINLTKVFRQKDELFISLLNQMRQGSLSPEASAIFKSLSRPLPPPPPSMPNTIPTELFPMRHEVSHANATRLAALPHSVHTFHSHDTFPNAPKSAEQSQSSTMSSIAGSSAGSVQPKPSSSASGNNRREGLLTGVLAEKVLLLKKGAQVMLVKNVDEILVNGCVGQVIGFYGYREVMSSLHGESEKWVGPTKTMGFVRNVKTHLNGTLSKVKETSGDKENDTDVAKVGKDAKENRISQLRKEEERFPLVEFPTLEGGKEAVLVMREEFKVEDSDGKVLARRMQVPLILAWAMSIHKSQGQTIQRVKVDLGKVFEKGNICLTVSCCQAEARCRSKLRGSVKGSIDGWTTSFAL
ncbi:hypothetical protein ID866_4641 [Astraeus odoratus]|nr:hypothetical protein ID866_4641 [Astraeus odoratus]